MTAFDTTHYPYPSRRAVVYGTKGMTCSSSPIATQVGMDMLKSGGNAIDAALAMATTLPLVEPSGNGLGSDCFALIWKADEGTLYGLDGSGYSPQKLTADHVRQAGFCEVPDTGWLPTMVPGAPGAWGELRRRFGTKSMEEIMAPAISYAREGFVVPVTVAELWPGEVARISAAYENNPAPFVHWMDYYTKEDRKPYQAGDRFYHPDFAKTLESLASSDCESYYRGEIMEQIVAFSDQTGGFFTQEDFQRYHPAWVEPITIQYKGYDVYEMPPNGHGITALMALNILKDLPLAEHKETADAYHKMIEAIKLAYADAKTFVADPRYMKTKVADMLSDCYAQVRRGLIGSHALTPAPGDPSCGDTVYFCTADGEGNMVSFIQSNYDCFGSGVAVPGTAITLQDRGANFSMNPDSDNYLMGGKKSYHTIIPGFLAKDGKAIGPFGVMGGFMQPQGHVQVVVNTVDYHMNPQSALDAPRFQWKGDKHIQLERQVPDHVVKQLADMGHKVEIVHTNLNMGRGQIIWWMEDGTLVGGTEPRADGAIACW